MKKLVLTVVLGLLVATAAPAAAAPSPAPGAQAAQEDRL